MDDPDRYATAVHEAGHAVIGTLVGMTVNRLTVEPTDDYWGMVSFAQPYGDEAMALTDRPEVMDALNADGVSLADYLPSELHADIEIARQEVARDAMTNMAGPRAEERHTGFFDQDKARSDLKKIGMFLSVFFCEYGGDEEAAWDAAVAHYDGPTIEEYLDDPLVWSWITAVAQTAYYAGDMTGDEVRELRPADLT